MKIDETRSDMRRENQKELSSSVIGSFIDNQFHDPYSALLFAEGHVLDHLETQKSLRGRTGIAGVGIDKGDIYVFLRCFGPFFYFLFTLYESLHLYCTRTSPFS